MSLPWDNENVGPNLDTLGRLRAGDHLGVLKKGENVGTVDGAKGNRGLRARFEIEGKFSQAFVRNKKGETILDDQQYLMPIVNVFHAGIKMFFNGGGVSAQQLLRAMQGVKKLSRTYTDGTKQAKVAEIIRRVRDELPMSLMSVIFQEPGVHRFQLGRQLGPTLENEILTRCYPTGNLDGVAKERTADVDPRLIPAVFGINAKSQPATYVPLTRHNYTRTGIGVCHQFWRDCAGAGVKMGTTFNRCDAQGLKRFYEFTLKDEGMMFAISQAANQASVAGAPAMILSKGVKVQGREVPLIEAAGDQRVFFLPNEGTATVTKEGAAFIVSMELKMDGNQQAFSFKNGGVDGGPGTLRQFGITSFEFELAVSLTRAGNRINLGLSKAEIVVTTIPIT